MELSQLHVNLTADLEEVRRALERARDGADERDVGGDIIAPRAVAAGDGADEASLLKGQGNRDAVDLRFDDEFEARATEGLIETFAEGPKVGLVVRIVQGQHRRPVVSLLESVGLVVADA